MFVMFEAATKIPDGEMSAVSCIKLTIDDSTGDVIEQEGNIDPLRHIIMSWQKWLLFLGWLSGIFQMSSPVALIKASCVIFCVGGFALQVNCNEIVQPKARSKINFR